MPFLSRNRDSWSKTASRAYLPRLSILDRLQAAKSLKIDTYYDSISRMVDVMPDKGVEHWARVFNLKQSAKSLAELEKVWFQVA